MDCVLNLVLHFVLAALERLIIKPIKQLEIVQAFFKLL